MNNCNLRKTISAERFRNIRCEGWLKEVRTASIRIVVEFPIWLEMELGTPGRI
jgi:hypothetical protein